MSQRKISAIYTALPARLLPWFLENARDLPWRQDKNPYHVWLSEIMLQQTRVEAVRGYFLRFTKAFPTISALAMADEDAVLKLWEGLGYYSRARNLHKAAKVIMTQHGGEFPTSYEAILALPGVGEYTAGAISSICFELPHPAVDGNVLRVAARLTNDSTPIDMPSVKKEVAASLSRIYPKGACGDFTQSLMELGAIVCIPKAPRCALCPLSDLCLSRKEGTAAQLPKRTPRRARTLSEKTVFLFMKDGKIAVRKREDRGLLKGLWELPNIEGKCTPDEAVRAAEKFGVSPMAPERALSRVHIFTHAEWHMICYYIPVKNTPDIFVWADTEKRKSEIALPTAFRIFLEEDNE